MAFDLLSLDGADLRDRPLRERTRLLARIMPRVESHVRYVDSMNGRGVEFFSVACAHDLEGIVAKWNGDLFDARSDNANAPSSAGEAATRDPLTDSAPGAQGDPR